MDRVLQRPDFNNLHRVEILMNLVPFCLSMHQLAMSFRIWGVTRTAISSLTPGMVVERARARSSAPQAGHERHHRGIEKTA